MTEQENRKVDAEIAKLIAETAKINKESHWYPLVVSSGIFAVVFAILKYIG